MIAVQILEQPAAMIPAAISPDFAPGHEGQDEVAFADDLSRLLREIDSLSVSALSGRPLTA